MIPTTVSNQITSNDLPLRTAQLSKAQMDGVQGGANTRWQCAYLIGSRWFYTTVVIWWGHTAGDAIWACRNWNSNCSRASRVRCYNKQRSLSLRQCDRTLTMSNNPLVETLQATSRHFLNCTLRFSAIPRGRKRQATWLVYPKLYQVTPFTVVNKQ